MTPNAPGGLVRGPQASWTGWDYFGLPRASPANGRHRVTANGHCAAWKTARLHWFGWTAWGRFSRLHAEPSHIQWFAVDDDAFGLAPRQRAKADLPDTLSARK
jgi:hypothetical protein